MTESEGTHSWVARIRSRDRSALEALYDRHAPAMLGLATRLLRDRLEAEDLVHDVFVEAWNKADSFSAERGSPGAWLMIRVRSRAIDRLRRAGVARRHALDTMAVEVASDAGHVDDPARAFDRSRVAEALSVLSQEQRIVIELAYFGGLSCAEIARRNDTPLGTVKSRLAAGTRALRRRFEAGSDEREPAEDTGSAPGGAGPGDDR